MLLTAERADNRDSGKDFPGYQVQTVNESLQLVNFGIAIWNSTKITIRMIATAAPRIQVMEESVWRTLSTPPMPRMAHTERF